MPTTADIYDPGLLFQDPSKSLGHLIKHLRGVYKNLGSVIDDINTLEHYCDFAQPIHIPSLVPTEHMLKVSVGLMTLGNSCYTLNGLFMRNAYGLRGYDHLLDGFEPKAQAALLHQQRALLRAQGSALQDGGETKIQVVKRFMRALFIE